MSELHDVLAEVTETFGDFETPDGHRGWHTREYACEAVTADGTRRFTGAKCHRDLVERLAADARSRGGSAVVVTRVKTTVAGPWAPLDGEATA